MKRTRDEILGQWEKSGTKGITYYAHCRDVVDTFVIGEKMIGWRSVGISAFISNLDAKFGPRIKGRRWEEGMLIFPAGLFTAKEIQICLGTDNP